MEYTRTRSFDAQVAFGIKFSKGEVEILFTEKISQGISAGNYIVWVTGSPSSFSALTLLVGSFDP